MPAPESFTLDRPDGTRLHGLCWRPPAAGRDPSRTVVLVHGLGEHVGRYAALAEWLTARGWTLRGHDHRGHGRSQGRRGTIASPHDLVDDLSAAIDALAAESSSPPLLLGQSLGGLVALTCALQRPDRVAGLVLTSPLLGPAPTAFQRLLLAVMSRLAPGLPVGNGIDSTKLSHDPAVGRAYRDDPLVHDRICARLGRFIIDAAREALERAPTLSVPTLLLYAGDDRLIDPEGSREFARRAPRSLLVAHEYPALWHEILNETPAERAAVLRDLAAWLAQRRSGSERRLPAA